MGNRRVIKAVIKTGAGIGLLLFFTFTLGRYSLQSEPRIQTRQNEASVSSNEGLLALPPSVLSKRILEPAKTLRLADREALYRGGWKFVEIPSAVASVIDLDPQALGEHESELQTQIQTGTHIGRALERLKEIAVRAGPGKTQTVAIEGIGNSPDPRAQSVLIELFKAVNSLSLQSKVLTYIQPIKTGDQSWVFLNDLLADSHATLQQKEQASYSLMQLKETSDSTFIENLPQDWKARFVQLRALASAQHHHRAPATSKTESP